MIDDIVGKLEFLGYEPVEDSTSDVSYKVNYMGMEPEGDSYYPEVRELYRIDLWVDEQETSSAREAIKEQTMRAVFQAVTNLIGGNILSTHVRESILGEDSIELPQISMVFRTITPRGDWS